MSVEMITILLTQILLFIISTYLILTESKYCKSASNPDIAIIIVIIINLIPIIGLLTSFGISLDCIRNIKKELEKYKNEREGDGL